VRGPRRRARRRCRSGRPELTARSDRGRVPRGRSAARGARNADGPRPGGRLRAGDHRPPRLRTLEGFESAR
jgi:hypothetical protein